MMICNCTLAGTQACKNCSRYNEYYAEQEINDIQNILHPLRDFPNEKMIIPKRKMGCWKHTPTYYPYCSECEWMPEENEMTGMLYNYCPNCGADMRGVK